MNKDSEFITVAKAAKLLGTTDGAIYYRLKKGLLETDRINDGPTLVLRSDVLASRKIVRGSRLPEDWITAKEAAGLLGVPLSTVYSRVRMGEISVLLTPEEGKTHVAKQYFSRKQVLANVDVRPARTQRHRKPYLFKPTREECYYFAGLFDGEGCVSVAVTSFPGANRYTIQLQVANTNRALLDWITPRFGGYIYHRKRYSPRDAPSWAWIVNSHTALEILRILEPLLVGKQEQARLAIRLQEQVEGLVASRWYPVTAEQQAEREALRQQIKELNRRGPRE